MKTYVIVSRDPGDPDQADMPVGEYLINVAEDGTPFLAYRLHPMARWGVPSRGLSIHQTARDTDGGN